MKCKRCKKEENPLDDIRLLGTFFEFGSESEWKHSVYLCKKCYDEMKQMMGEFIGMEYENI